MKINIIKYITFSLFLASSVAYTSCDLEREPLTSISEDTFWKDESSDKLALTALYRGSIPDGVEFTSHDFWSYHGLLLMDHLSDNAFDRRGENNLFFGISSGKLNSSNSFIYEYWKSAYYRISLCNRFLQGLEKQEETPEVKRYRAEARFLRATQYHYLASYFKDVPLVTTVLTGEEANNVKKETQANILAWADKEFQEAAEDLPRFSELSSSENGRATKQAALAFLGRDLLLEKKWSEAAAVYKQIIDLGDNAIHSSYRELFWPGTGAGNKENIFYIQYLENYLGCGMPQHCLSAKDGGWSLSNPTASLFEEYEFKDGSKFSYDDPRYNPNNLGENRDPRLDYSIYYNGATFKGTEYKLSPDNDASKKERIDYASECSKTGYMWRKYFDENPISDITSYSAVTPVIRYAEVLLSYLEAKVEAGDKITQQDLDISINQVRGRADVNMPKITETDNDKLRQLVRHERRVELTMEGLRYWDILRWGIADSVLVGPIWGAPYPNSPSYATGTKEIDPTGHCRWYVGRRDFRSPQDYTWPIPLSEQNINPNLRDK